MCLKQTMIATLKVNWLPVAGHKHEDDVDGDPREQNFSLPEREPVLVSGPRLRGFFPVSNARWRQFNLLLAVDFIIKCRYLISAV